MGAERGNVIWGGRVASCSSGMQARGEGAGGSRAHGQPVVNQRSTPARMDHKVHTWVSCTAAPSPQLLSCCWCLCWLCGYLQLRPACYLAAAKGTLNILRPHHARQSFYLPLNPASL